MSKAYLTIDDGPTINTRRYVDFLLSKNIIPMMSFIGGNIPTNKENGIYAIKKGIIVANHSFSHPHFSEISFQDAIEEIEKQEKLINELYKEAGVERRHKLFRFPFGDKGGKNKEKLQEYLRAGGFSKIDDSKISYEWYKNKKLNNETDVLWSFDCEEYRLQWDNSFKYEDVISKIDNPDSYETGTLIGNDDLYNIILIHDHPQNQNLHPGYFENIINHIISKGVEFITPEFLKPFQ